MTAGDLWEDEIWDVLTDRHVQLARDAGALSEVHLALTSRIGVDVLTGELTRAAWLVEELDTVIEATGSRRAPYGGLLLAAWQGREDTVAEPTGDHHPGCFGSRRRDRADRRRVGTGGALQQPGPVPRRADRVTSHRPS